MRTFLLTVFVTFFLFPATMTAASEEGPSPEDVAFVQGLLLRFGYDPGPIDGVCGDLTAAAVRAFHEDRDLPLEPGDVEPQAATVVHNLMTTMVDSVVAPSTSAAKIYKDALSGSADAAMRVGEMYHRGDKVGTDMMLAYAWWSVAESRGDARASEMKADLISKERLSGHELEFASVLAETILTSRDSSGSRSLKNESPTIEPVDEETRQQRHNATM